MKQFYIHSFFINKVFNVTDVTEKMYFTLKFLEYSILCLQVRLILTVPLTVSAALMAAPTHA
jgi:hypothetical protein